MIEQNADPVFPSLPVEIITVMELKIILDDAICAAAAIKDNDKKTAVQCLERIEKIAVKYISQKRN